MKKIIFAGVLLTTLYTSQTTAMMDLFFGKTVSIENINKAELLVRLHDNLEPVLGYKKGNLELSYAKYLIKSCKTPIGKINGRLISMDFRGNTVNTSKYNRNRNEGAKTAEAIIKEFEEKSA